MEEKEKFKQYWFLALKIIGVLFALLLFIWLWDEISWLVSLFLISVLVVYSINPLADWLENKGLSRTAATTITFLIFLLAIIGLLLITIPRFYSEVMALANYAPMLYEHLEKEGYLEELHFLMEGTEIRAYIGSLIENLPDALEDMQDFAQHLIQFFIQLITTFFEILILAFLIFYMLKDIREIKQGILAVVPAKYKDEAREVMRVIDLKVGQFLRGNLIRCSLVGVVTGLGLFILDIRFYFILGVIAGILNIIVYIGPYLAAIPALLIALTYSLETTIIVGLLYIFIQSIDAFILYPVLLGRAVDLTPFTTIVAISVGGAVYGIVGFIISVPLVAILKVLLNYYYLDENNKIENKKKET